MYGPVSEASQASQEVGGVFLTVTIACLPMN